MPSVFPQVLFGIDHPWDPTLYDDSLQFGPSLQCELMKRVSVQVGALCSDTHIARLTGSRRLINRAFEDKALLYSHYSLLYFGQGLPHESNAHWISQHHPEALSTEHQARSSELTLKHFPARCFLKDTVCAA